MLCEIEQYNNGMHGLNDFIGKPSKFIGKCYFTGKAFYTSRFTRNFGATGLNIKGEKGEPTTHPLCASV